jgi:hypothetical protein
VATKETIAHNCLRQCFKGVQYNYWSPFLVNISIFYILIAMTMRVVHSSSSSSSSTLLPRCFSSSSPCLVRLTFSLLMVLSVVLSLVSIINVGRKLWTSDIVWDFAILLSDTNSTNSNGSAATWSSTPTQNSNPNKVTMPSLQSHHHDVIPTTSTSKQHQQPLNILILYPDDWRHDSLQDAQSGDNDNNVKIFTPFLSELAKDGIRFTHNAVTTSICWISRATLFTGQYVSRHLSQRLYCPTFTLPHHWQDTWVARLQQHHSYFVGHVGKWQYHNSKAFFQSAFNVSCRHVFGVYLEMYCLGDDCHMRG